VLKPSREHARDQAQAAARSKVPAPA